MPLSPDAGLPTTLPQILSLQADQRPDAVALWWQGESLCYRDLQQQVAQLAARFAAHGAVGDRIGILAWNCPEYLVVMYAAAASGRILVPINTRLAAAEWRYQLTSAGVSLLTGDADLLTSLEADAPGTDGIEVVPLGEPLRDWCRCGPSAELPAISAVDAVWILYTSGSTGKPRGAVLSHRSIIAGLRSAALGRPVLAHDRYYYPFPLFHVAAHNVLLQHLYGAAVVLARRFDALETLTTCRELGVTTLSLAPTMISMLLDHEAFDARDLHTVRTIGYGAAAMPAQLLNRLLRETTVGLCQSYGMTELAGSIAFLTPAEHRLAATDRPELLQSVGRPLATAEIRLASASGAPCAANEAGEILVRAEQVMLGYWQQPQASADALRDGWLHTGDIGRLDEQGYLYLVDRKKDMIISGGENVASREVEEVLRQHPAVRDCAVIGLPDEHWGEMVVAVVELTEDVDDNSLATHCRDLLAAYKTPKRWHRVPQLPLNAAGKIAKPLLRERYHQIKTTPSLTPHSRPELRRPT